MTLIINPPPFTLLNLVQVKKPGHLIRQRWASPFCLNMIAIKPDYEAGQNEFFNFQKQWKFPQNVSDRTFPE